MKRITQDPAICGGRPCIRGMRIMVSDILGWLAAGMSEEHILQDYPELTIDDIRDCLIYAAQVVKEYRVSPTITPAPWPLS